MSKTFTSFNEDLHTTPATRSQRAVVSRSLFASIREMTPLSDNADWFRTASGGAIIAALPDVPDAPVWTDFIDSLGRMVKTIVERKNGRVHLEIDASDDERDIADLHHVLVGSTSDGSWAIVALLLDKLGEPATYLHSIFGSDYAGALDYARMSARIMQPGLLAALDGLTADEFPY